MFECDVMQRVEAPFDFSDFVLIVQEEIPTSGTPVSTTVTHSVLLPKLSILSVFLYKLTIIIYKKTIKM